MKRQVPRCAWCNKPGANERDHVVPKVLFPRGSRPHNLLTVPSCSRCNRDLSLDEEYFAVAVLGPASFHSPQASRLLDSLAASKQRRRALLARRFKRAVVREFEPATGTPGMFQLEVPRINRVLAKVVRGLHFHRYGTMPALSEVALVEILPEPQWRENALYRVTLTQPSVSIGEGVFSYRHVQASDSQATFWVLKFFDSVEACGMIVPTSLTT